MAAVRTKERIFALIGVLLGILLGLAGLETVMRVVPVHTGVRLAPVTVNKPIVHLQPNESFTFSTGWTLKNVNRGRINNAGFVNDQDYHKQEAKPLLARHCRDGLPRRWRTSFASTASRRAVRR